jgi:EAL domain-containing protein (putative c-di-GMP-specific phosphodiesterase class I)
MLVRFDHMGMKISIDDFGTGYSSLAYLKKLPIHELKIDRSFIDGIATERDDRSIAVAIIEMSRALGMRVVAEGVETQDQLNVLTEEGCDMVQGYLFYRSLIRFPGDCFDHKQSAHADFGATMIKAFSRKAYDPGSFCRSPAVWREKGVSPGR